LWKEPLQTKNTGFHPVSRARQYENYYEYDPAGNRTLLRHGETDADNLTYYQYNEANELTRLHDSSGWTYFQYDSNGNTIEEQTPTYTRYFDWDGRDMMISVRSTEDGWTDNEIEYDGLASRKSLIDSTGTTYYTWDGINVLKTEDDQGSLKQRQVHGYAPIVSVGDISMMEISDAVYIPVSDQPGTIWNLLDSAPAKANSYTYDAFGVGRSASETVTNPCRFGTKPLDTDPNLYHFVARQYAAILGRFVSRDPAGIQARASLYDFAFGHPLHFSDPYGLRVICPDQCRKGQEQCHVRDIRFTPPGTTVTLLNSGFSILAAAQNIGVVASVGSVLAGAAQGATQAFGAIVEEVTAQTPGGNADFAAALHELHGMVRKKRRAFDVNIRIEHKICKRGCCGPLFRRRWEWRSKKTWHHCTDMWFGEDTPTWGPNTVIVLADTIHGREEKEYLRRLWGKIVACMRAARKEYCDK